MGALLIRPALVGLSTNYMVAQGRCIVRLPVAARMPLERTERPILGPIAKKRYQDSQMDLTLHPGQEAVIDSTARFIGGVAGAQGGKTTVGAMWLCAEIWSNHEKGRYGDYLIAAPSAKIMEQSTLPKFKGVVPSDWVTWHEAKQFFELPWQNPETGQKCRIYVRSTDDPDAIEGMTLLAAWLDEAGKMESPVWVNVQARVAKFLGRVLVTTTPYASKWIKREIADKAKRPGEKDFAYFNWPSNMNPAFSTEEFERLRQTLPEMVFRRRHMGEFTTAEGLVYPDFDYDTHVVKPFIIPDSWVRFGGMDFGHSQPTVVLCVAEDPQDHCFYVYREFYRKEAFLKDIANFLNNEALKYILADPQGAQAIAELNRFYGRSEVKAADNKVEIGIERIGTLLKEGRLKFFSNCVNVLDEIEDYHYPAPTDDKADKPDKPVKKDDHAMDSLKYAFSRQITSLYPYRNQARANLRERLARRRLPDTDPWTNY